MKKLLVFIFLLICINIFSENKIVRLATLDWEPYIGQNLKNNGYVGELVREAFLRVGYDVEYTFLPWARVVVSTKQGKYDGYFPEYYSEDIEEEFIFSDKFKGGPLGFFKKKGSNITYKKLIDLKTYKIGVVRGYVNTIEFDQADYLIKDEATSDLQNITKLLKNRMDLIVADKFVGLYTLEKELPNENKDAIEFLEPSLEEKSLYLCFFKANEKSKELSRVFNQGLEKIIEDGTFDKILKKHGF